MDPLLTASWNNRPAAVSLTFDDGMRSHLDVAVPLLNDHDLRGTFYLVAGGNDDGRAPG